MKDWSKPKPNLLITPDMGGNIRALCRIATWDAREKASRADAGRWMGMVFLVLTHALAVHPLWVIISPI
jgi:hypothetical protein